MLKSDGVVANRGSSLLDRKRCIAHRRRTLVSGNGVATYRSGVVAQCERLITHCNRADTRRNGRRASCDRILTRHRRRLGGVGEEVLAAALVEAIDVAFEIGDAVIQRE
ncbi:hypothetical protein D9M70_606880 [compost metagenome]